MNHIRRAAVRAVLPIAVFVAGVAFHFVWLGVFPEKVATEASCGDDCAACEAPAAAGWLDRYVAGQSCWLGYSYATSLAFAVAALRRYREQRLCTARNVALGGVTASGLLAVFGCYLLGCCGSPMFPIYLGLFGAAFLPLAKPLVAGLTTLSLIAAWWWLRRQERRAARAVAASAVQPAIGCCDPSASCCPVRADSTGPHAIG